MVNLEDSEDSLINLNEPFYKDESASVSAADNYFLNKEEADDTVECYGNECDSVELEEVSDEVDEEEQRLINFSLATSSLSGMHIKTRFSKIYLKNKI